MQGGKSYGFKAIVGWHTTGPSPEHALALVRKSPELVRTHDRAGWLGLFGTDGSIEDPVGSPPARPRAPTR